MERDDDYIFKKDGSSEKIITDDKFDRVITDRNKELEYLVGGDKYDFAEKKGDTLVYEVPKGVIDGYDKISPMKEANDVGTIFTVTDKKHADNIYRMVAGNSLVEYGKSDYTNPDNLERSNIWTNAHSSKLNPQTILDTVNSGGKVQEKTHSHPFKGAEGNANSLAYPSEADLRNAKKFSEYDGLKEIKHKVYSPYNPLPDKQPWSISYNKNGAEGFDSDSRVYSDTIMPNNLKADYEKNVPKKEKERLKKYYLWDKK